MNPFPQSLTDHPLLFKDDTRKAEKITLERDVLFKASLRVARTPFYFSKAAKKKGPEALRSLP
jgi:hypothetical protein